jgi:sugar phosphate isomerase/epimerase
MKLGLVTYRLAENWDVDTIIEKCAQNGFEGVELRTTHAHGVEVALSAGERAEVRRKFEDSPVALAGLGSAFEYHSPDRDELREQIEGTKEYARLAADVGAPGIKVRPNGLAVDQGVPESETLEQIGRALAECAEFAAPLGVQVRLEVHGPETCRTPRIARIMEVADHPNARVCWNSNEADLLDGGFDAAFDRLKDRIALVHMRDLCEPGYPWRLLIRRLSEIGYEGFCLSEIMPNEDPDRIMRFARALFDALRDLADNAPETCTDAV